MFIGKKSLKALHGNAFSDFYQPKCPLSLNFKIEYFQIIESGVGWVSKPNIFPNPKQKLGFKNPSCDKLPETKNPSSPSSQNPNKTIK